MPDNNHWSLKLFLKSIVAYLFCRDIPLFEKIFILGLGILYFLLPLDVIPDVFLPFGLLDDFSIGALILAYMSHRLNKVMEFRRLNDSGSENRIN